MSIFIGLLFIIGLSALLGAILWKLNMRDRRVYILFVISLLIHISAVLFIYVFDFQPFSGGGGDYTSYHKSAVQISEGIREGNLWPDAEERGGVPHLYPAIIGYVYFFTVPSMVVGQLFNAWTASLAIIFLYFIVLEILQSSRWALGIGLLANLYPSFLFYSSLLLKDVFVVLFTLATALLMLRILKSFSFRLFVLFYISLIALTHFRFYEGFIFLVAFILSWFLLSSQPIKTRLTYGLAMIFFLGFIPQMFGMGYFGFSTLRQYIRPDTVAYYQDIAYTGKDVVVVPPAPESKSETKPEVANNPMPPSPPVVSSVSAKPVSVAPVSVAPVAVDAVDVASPPSPVPSAPVDVASAPLQVRSSSLDELQADLSEENVGFASTVDLKISFGSPQEFVATFLESFAFVSIGPFPWQFAAKRHYFALLETVPWTILSIFVLLGIIHALRSKHVALSFVIFSFGLFLILMIYMSNFGITTRIRMPAFFLLATFIPFGVIEYQHWKHRIYNFFCANKKE